MFYLKWHKVTLGSVRADPYKYVTFWGSLSKIWPTSYRTELAVYYTSMRTEYL